MKFKIRRLTADLVDVILCACLAGIFSVLPAILASRFRVGVKTALLVELIMTCVFFLLRDVFDGSIGKKMFRLKIVDWEGNRTGLGVRIRRNLTVPLFLIEIVMIIGGYDTLGDTLAYTCVVDRSFTGTPGMKKGNNTLRTLAVVLLVGVVAAFVIVYAVRSLMVSGSAGYEALKEYMAGSEIIEEYGKDPVWKVNKMDKGDERITYNVTVNGEELDVTTVSINGKWFVLGVQTETANSLATALEKIVSDRTMYVSIADLDRDKKVEIIEFSIGEESATLCSIYSLDDAALVGSFEINCGSPGSTGKWQLYHDISGADKMIIEYSRYSSSITEKNIAVVDAANNHFSLDVMFSEIYTTQSELDEEGNETKKYFTSFYYNGRSISPADYFENQTDFNSRYTPATVDTLYTYRWQKTDDLEEAALIAAVTLVDKGWD